MSDAVREHYELLPYRQSAFFRLAHSRLGFVGRLFGIQTAPPDHCRVLELGCGEGMHLLPLAERFPDSTFVGIDFSDPEIAVAQAAKEACQLSNIEFIRGDILEYQPEPESFDYIIAHGVYSWVPPHVRDRVFQICRSALKRTGIACVSYNAQPGWAMWRTLRPLLLKEVAKCATPKEKIDRARLVLGVLLQGMEDRKDPYGEMIRAEIARRIEKDPVVLYHDELDTFNEAVTFLEFYEHSQRFDLEYLADAHLGSSVTDTIPAKLRSLLPSLEPDLVLAQQYLDIATNRAFRSTLLCRPDAGVQRIANPDAFEDAALFVRVAPTSPTVDFQAGVSMEFAGRTSFRFQSDKPLTKAFLTVITRQGTRRVPYREAMEAAKAELAAVGISPEPEEESFLRRTLLGMNTLEMLDVVLAGDAAHPPYESWLRRPSPREELRTTPLTRYLAVNRLTPVNWWHEAIAITEQQRIWIAEGRDSEPYPDESRVSNLHQVSLLW